MKNNVYEKVKEQLINHPATRDSDKKLIFNYWVMERIFINENGVYYTNPTQFMYCTPAESITRARRMVQELHPELRSSKSIEKERKLKEKQKGTFVFREH